MTLDLLSSDWLAGWLAVHIFPPVFFWLWYYYYTVLFVDIAAAAAAAPSDTRGGWMEEKERGRPKSARERRGQNEIFLRRPLSPKSSLIFHHRLVSKDISRDHCHSAIHPFSRAYKRISGQTDRQTEQTATSSRFPFDWLAMSISFVAWSKICFQP